MKLFHAIRRNYIWLERYLKQTLLFIAAIKLFCDCNFEKKTIATKEVGTIYLKRANDSLYYIRLQTDSSLNEWELPYPVYQFATGDIDNDQIEDILVGVVKSTRFDSVPNKRLFIFKNYQGYIRPKWLGSKMPQPLEDFSLVNNVLGSKNILTIEKEKSGNYLVAEYKWRKFGIEFVKYLEKEIDLQTARKIVFP